MQNVYTMTCAGRELVVVELDPTDDADSNAARREGRKLKKLLHADAVLVQHSTTFWVL